MIRFRRVIEFLSRDEPIDSLVAFRIAFGVFAAAWAWDYLASGRVTDLYVRPEFHFTYSLFPWVKPWSGDGMYWHFITLLIAALAITAGFLYRLSSVTFAIGFTYFLLIDRANYQNHYYLMVILAWSLVAMPLHKSLSIDAMRRPSIRSITLPAWALWLTRFHIALPYFFGGVSKLTADWLLGEPMNLMLTTGPRLPIVGSLLAIPGMGLLFSYGGLIFDLTIVPLLLWPKTRLYAYIGCIAFHLMNAALFDIHVFPWLMIAATTVFFEPDWPRRFWLMLTSTRPLIAEGTGHPSGDRLSAGVASEDLPATILFHGQASSSTPPSAAPETRVAPWWLVLLLLHVSLQVALPFRHRLYEGNTAWTERGHLFAWRMMLRGKTGGIRMYVTDPKAKRSWLVDFRGLLSQEQFGRFPRDPRMVLQMAKRIGELEREFHGREVEVHALVLLSLSGRKPELMIDPNRDLTKVPDSGFEWTRAVPDWILPQTEPLRSDPWVEPLENWERLVELPPLRFLETAPLRNNPSPARPQG